MTGWKMFELDATDYLNNMYGDLACFEHQGGTNFATFRYKTVHRTVLLTLKPSGSNPFCKKTTTPKRT